VPPGGFGLRILAAGDEVTRLALSGELDLATAPVFDQALSTAQTRTRSVTVDLRRLTFMDCRGLSVLLSAASRARASGERFRVVRGPPAIDRLFELTGTDRVLETLFITPE
jgi:anti-sigma B factor antagonist